MRPEVIVHKTRKGYAWKDDCALNNCIFAVKSGGVVDNDKLYNFCKRYGLIYYYPIKNIDFGLGTPNDLTAVKELADKLGLTVIVK